METCLLDPKPKAKVLRPAFPNFADSSKVSFYHDGDVSDPVLVPGSERIRRIAHRTPKFKVRSTSVTNQASDLVLTFVATNNLTSCHRRNSVAF